MFKTALNMILARLNRGPWPYGGKQKTRAKKTLHQLARLLFQARAPLPINQNPLGLELSQEDWEILDRLSLARGNGLAFKELGFFQGPRAGSPNWQVNWARLAGQGLIYVKASPKAAGFGLELTDAGRLALLLKPRPCSPAIWPATGR